MTDAATATGLTFGLILTVFGLGLRHGIDWDHVAAISDITQSQSDRRRSLFLATLYAAGHAAVVFVLGIGAIALGARVPAGLDALMVRVVGLTLVGLGTYVLVDLVRNGREARLRSRWMLVIAFVRRRRQARRDLLVVEHDHDHDDLHHSDVPVEASSHAAVPVAAGSGPSDRAHGPHRHAHRHVGPLPDDPFATYGARTTLGVGMLHGIGAETPSQVLLLVTAAGVAGTAGGVAVLAAFLGGLFVSNTLIAVATTFGFRRTGRGAVAFLVFSTVVAIGSIVVGGLFLLGQDALLPPILS